MADVWVVQEVSGRINLLPAEDFGELKYLRRFHEQIPANSDSAVSTIKTKLRKFSDDDFLVPVGDPAAIGIACCVAAQQNRGRFKLLKWDRQEKRYYVVQVSMN